MFRPFIFSSRTRVLVACCGLLALLPGHAFAQSKSKPKAAPLSTKPLMVCDPGFYKCTDAYGNCCRIGWTCTYDGKCAPPAGGASMSSEPTPKSDKGGKAGPKYNNEGEFQLSGGGGATTKPGKAKAYAPKNANVAQWPGFRLTSDGGSEVMVEFSKDTAAPTEHRAAGSITYVFKGAHVLKSNNQNPLITVHFNTPVASARLVPKGSELHLLIEYRAGASAAATTGMRPGVDGTGQQFFVKFPSGSWLPNGAENGDLAPVPTQKLKAKGKADEKPAAPLPPNTESGSKTGPSP